MLKEDIASQPWNVWQDNPHKIKVKMLIYLFKKLHPFR